MLVVDDEAQVRASFATLLEGDGYKVLQASNGREAQARCRETPVDVAIIDIVVPEQEEGLETVQNIRRDWPQTGLIAIS